MSSFPTESRGRQSFSFYCARSNARPITAWATARDCLERNGVLADAYAMTFATTGGQGGARHLTVHPEDVAEALVRERAASFTLRYDVADHPQQMISFGPAVGCPGYASFSVASKTPKLALPSWVPLIESMAANVRLAIAGLNDPDYTAWQRCSDPQRYVKNYGSIDQFRILHPLPPPLDKIEELDTSKNPGRIDSIRGGPAFVCADLWLGSAFWTYAPCREKELLAQPWLEVRNTEHFLYIKAYAEPFSRPDGEQGDLQRKLWQLLFKSDCHWPPGSVR